MTKARQMIQVPARRAAKALPGTLAVGQAVVEIEPTASNGSGPVRFTGRWSRQGLEGEAYIELTPISKVNTEIQVTLERPSGLVGLAATPGARRRLAALFAQALAYDIQTRSTEEASPFEVRRTSRELVRARSA